MTPNDYQKEALRTEPEVLKDKTALRLINGLLGLTGEAGETAELVKKNLFHGHDLDREHLARELGDVMWYLAVTADALGYPLEEILEMNVKKLRARYPEGFSSDKSMHRKEGDL